MLMFQSFSHSNSASVEKDVLCR